MSRALMFEPAVALADAVLFERDPRDPARASSRAGPFGRPAEMLAPAGWSGRDPWWMQTECLLGPMLAGTIDARLRFLQPIVGAKGLVRELDFAVDLRAALREEQSVPFVVEAGRLALEGGQSVEWPSIRGLLRTRAEVLPTRPRSVRVRVRVENRSPWQEAGAGREAVQRRSCMSPHLLLHAETGHFLSLIHPPWWAERAAESCHNVRTFPVLAGPADHDDLMLSAPVVLYDHPEIERESAGDDLDASDQGEALSFRVLLTRKFGPGAADVVDGGDTLPPELLARLRRAIQRMRATALGPRDDA